MKEYLEVYKINRYPIKDSNPINKRVIDYLYEVKDQHNFGRLQKIIDLIFSTDEIMSFLCSLNQLPSDALQAKYRHSSLNSMLSLPTFEDLK